jgi:hypothetical protein
MGKTLSDSMRYNFSRVKVKKAQGIKGNKRKDRTGNSKTIKNVAIISRRWSDKVIS